MRVPSPSLPPRPPRATAAAVDGPPTDLDSTFCAFFHSWKGLWDPSGVFALVSALTFTVWGSSLFIVLYQLYRIVSTWFESHPSIDHRCRVQAWLR